MLQRIKKSKIIAIVRGLQSDHMIGLGNALLAGGIDLMEVTFNQKNPDSWKDTAKAISAIKQTFGSRIGVGAGTVMSIEQLHIAYEAGAAYVISPNVSEVVIRETKKLGLVSIPGAMTATEAAQAAAMGADFVKIFPVGNLGPGYIKALKAPLSNIEFLAVGGVNEKNAADFLRAGAAGIGVGGNLVNTAWIENGEFEKITALAAAYVEAVK